MKPTTPTNHKRGPKPDSDLLDKAKLVQSARKLRVGLYHAPQDLEGITQLAKEVETWALEEDALILEEFILSKNLKPVSFYNLARDNAILGDAVKNAKYAISTRFQKALIRNPAYLMKYLPYLNEQMNAWEIDKNKALKNEAVVDNRVQYVVIESDKE